MTLEFVLRLVLAASPRAPAHRAEHIADAIVHATKDPREATEMVALALVETGMGRAGVPFGATCHRGPDRSLEAYATAAVRVLRNARRDCGPSTEARMSYYLLGHCRVDAEAARRARVVRRLSRRGTP